MDGVLSAPEPWLWWVSPAKLSWARAEPSWDQQGTSTPSRLSGTGSSCAVIGRAARAVRGGAGLQGSVVVRKGIQGLGRGSSNQNPTLALRWRVGAAVLHALACARLAFGLQLPVHRAECRDNAPAVSASWAWRAGGADTRADRSLLPRICRPSTRDGRQSRMRRIRVGGTATNAAAAPLTAEGERDRWPLTRRAVCAPRESGCVRVRAPVMCLGMCRAMYTSTDRLSRIRLLMADTRR